MQQTAGIETRIGRTVVRRSAWVRGAAVVLGLVLSFHFAATSLWVSPAAPLYHALAPALNPYMQPFFQARLEPFRP